MFGLSFTEVLIILALALIVLGPKRLPEMARTIGKGLRELRRASDDLKGTFDAEIYRDEQPVPSPSRKGLPPSEPWRPSDDAEGGYPDTGGYEDVPAEDEAGAAPTPGSVESERFGPPRRAEIGPPDVVDEAWAEGAASPGNPAGVAPTDGSGHAEDAGDTPDERRPDDRDRRDEPGGA